MSKLLLKYKGLLLFGLRDLESKHSHFSPADALLSSSTNEHLKHLTQKRADRKLFVCPAVSRGEKDKEGVGTVKVISYL